MKKAFLGFAMILLTGWVNAQAVEFSVSLNADTIGLDNRLEVTFTLKNAQGARFEPPQFDGFRLLSGPNTSSQFSIVNGEMTSSISYTYILEPLEIGQYYIQPAVIEAEGKTLETTLQEVWVFPEWEAPARLKPQQDNDFWNRAPSRIPREQPKENPGKKRPVTKM